MKPNHTVGPRDLLLLIQEIPQVLRDVLRDNFFCNIVTEHSRLSLIKVFYHGSVWTR